MFLRVHENALQSKHVVIPMVLNKSERFFFVPVTQVGPTNLLPPNESPLVFILLPYRRPMSHRSQVTFSCCSPIDFPPIAEVTFRR